ncbi:acyltransferase family protein [Asaia astilbis]|uniref:acyltransferase family protein n=1 Tax=Asaia astilbis TaxID=610244 RepID=UPI00047201AF|nr:acyltransferase family protein [Asaia astilbis]
MSRISRCIYNPEKESARGYRPDLDGLRAVAVSAVLLYHLFPDLMPGGFSGVDIFFVLSGFLITSHLNEELEQGRFSCRGFYARRLRRLVPALVFVLIGTALAGSLILLPGEFASLGLDWAAGASSLSNFLSWGEQGYFDRAAELKPLIHLWSLGVEEQFYIFWPVLLLMTHGTSLTLRRIGLMLAIPSFLLSITSALFWPESGFYCPLTRLWEFMAGGLLITLPLKHRRSVGWMGIILIISGFALLRSGWFFPGFTALLPVAGTAFLIAAGPDHAFSRRVLSASPICALGRISYALYLWHWPLIAFTHIVHGTRPLRHSTGMTILVIAFVLAVFTTCYVERPLRWNRYPGATSLGLLSVLLLLVGSGLLTWCHHGWPGRVHHGSVGIEVAKINLAERDGIFPITSHMKVRHERGLTIATIGSNLGHPVLLTGDSLLFQWAPRIDALFSQGKLSRAVIFISGPSCSPLAGEHYKPAFAFCSAMPEIQQKILRDLPIKKIVIGAYWLRVFGDDSAQWPALRERFTAAIKSLSGDGKRPVTILLPTPTDIRFDPAKMVQRSYTHVTIDTGALRAGVPLGPWRTETAEIARILKSIADQTGATTLDLTSEICGGTTVCFPLTEEGKPKFADAVHLRPFFTSKEIHGLDLLLEEDAPEM